MHSLSSTEQITVAGLKCLSGFLYSCLHRGLSLLFVNQRYTSVSEDEAFSWYLFGLISVHVTRLIWGADKRVQRATNCNKQFSSREGFLRGMGVPHSPWGKG